MNEQDNKYVNIEFARVCAQLPEWEREKMRKLLLMLCHNDQHAGLLTSQLKQGRISASELLKSI